MASQSAIAEGDSVVTADQINYNQNMFYHPSYRFTPIFGNSFGQPIVLGSSQVPQTLNLPPEVFNLAQSYLLYSVNLLLHSATTFIWYAQQALKEISHIQFYSGSNMWIVDLDNVQNYLDIVLKKELEQDEYLCMDPLLSGFGSNNSLVNVVPASRNSNNAITNTANLQGNPSYVNYTESSYYQVGALGTGVSYQVQFPLRLIKNTAFSVDKNMYFGQTTYMKVYFGPTSKICYASTSNSHPSAGNKAAYAPANSATIGPPYAGGAYTAPVTAINFQLMLAVETNQDLRTMIMNQVQSSGLSYLIPHVQVPHKTSLFS